MTDVIPTSKECGFEALHRQYLKDRDVASVNCRIAIYGFAQWLDERFHNTIETLSVGCLSYWRHHENRCVRPRDHAGECYYVTPGRAIMENMDFKPPLPLVTDRVQGVDCPDCEDGTPHQHAQKAKVMHKCKGCGAEGEPGSPDFCSADCFENYSNTLGKEVGQ